MGNRVVLDSGHIALGAIYQQALRNYIDQAFSDLITAAQYSEGRIATVDYSATAIADHDSLEGGFSF